MCRVAGICDKSDMERDLNSRRTGSSIKLILLAALAAFLLGGALVYYLAAEGNLEMWQAPAEAEPRGAVSDAEPGGRTSEPVAAPTPVPTPLATDMAAVVAQQQGGIEQRLDAAEQRLTRLDMQAQAAAGNAARAEGLLIAFATRRALERGAELGYLADQLRLRFGDALPNAVSTVISASRDPVTLDRLIARLDGLRPDLRANTSATGLARVRQELSELFVIRRESAPSPQPERRMERARLFLESGRVSAAVAEIRNLPGAAEAQEWIEDAERYAATQRALDLIETAAVLEPRRLRDASGNPVGQLGGLMPEAEE